MEKKTVGFLVFFLLTAILLPDTEPGKIKTEPDCFSDGWFSNITHFHLTYADSFPLYSSHYSGMVTLNKAPFFYRFRCSNPNPETIPLARPTSNRGKKKYLGKAILFNLGIWLIDSIRYWATYAEWIEDWQFELSWEDQKKRFFSFTANKFDSNPFITNWTHALSGAIYYNFARYYGLKQLEALLFEFCASVWWEYITEWREVISVNDNFFSGTGGLPLGEVLFQIGSYFSNKPGSLNKIVGYIFNPVMALNDLLGSKKWKNKPDFPESSRPRFNFYFGPKQASFKGENNQSSLLFNLGLNTIFNTIPDYGKPGIINQLYKKTLLSEIHFDITWGENSIEEYSILARTVLLGYFSQKIKLHPSKSLNGHSLYIGVGSSLDLFRKKAITYYDKGDYHFDFTAGEYPSQPTEFTDKFAIINLIGPVFDLAIYSGDWKVKLGLGVYFDFALVNALALNEYSRTNDLSDPQMKSTLAHYGYYYAFGFTITTTGSLDYKNFEIASTSKYQYYDSIEGLDRFQENVIDDCNINDSRFMYKISLSYSFVDSPVKMEIAYEGIDRHGSIKDIDQKRVENRIYTQVKIFF